MTVNDVMTKIKEIESLIRQLTDIGDAHEMRNGEAITITDTIDMLDEYITELGRKKIQ